MTQSKWTIASLIGAALTAFAASVCCIGPILLFFGLSVSTTWIATLAQFSHLRIISIILLILFFILAFWRLYIMPKCSKDEGQLCNKRPSQQLILKIIFWLLVITSVFLITFPYYSYVLF